MAQEPASYRIEVSSSAVKQLRKLAKRDHESLVRIDAAILALGKNPRLSGVEQLTNEDNLSRYRVGDYRIVFAIHDDRRLIVIRRVKHRKDVYRRKK